jgi:hypothetical protein
MAFFDPVGHPQFIWPVIAVLSPWTHQMESGISLFEMDLRIFDTLFDISLAEEPPPFQPYAIQVLTNLLEDSEPLCTAFAARFGFNRFLDSIPGNDTGPRPLCLLRLFSAFLQRRPDLSGLPYRVLFDRFRHRFDFFLTECDPSDFIFLIRYVKWSASTAEYFLDCFRLGNLWPELPNFTDDRLPYLFELIFELTQFSDEESDYYHEYSSPWPRLRELPYDAFVECFNDGYRRSHNPRSPAAQRAYVEFLGRVIKADPGALAEIATTPGLALLGRWIGGEALSVRRESAGLFCEIASRLGYPIELFHTASLFAHICELLADVDDTRLALSLANWVHTVIDRMADQGHHAEVLEAFERDGVWERLEEIAFDPDAPAGPEVSARLESIARGKDALVEAVEAARDAERRREEQERIACEQAADPIDGNRDEWLDPGSDFNDPYHEELWDWDS